jgi:hypothetical protein
MLRVQKFKVQMLRVRGSKLQPSYEAKAIKMLIYNFERSHLNFLNP